MFFPGVTDKPFIASMLVHLPANTCHIKHEKHPQVQIFEQDVNARTSFGFILFEVEQWHLFWWDAIGGFFGLFAQQGQIFSEQSAGVAVSPVDAIGAAPHTRWFLPLCSTEFFPGQFQFANLTDPHGDGD